MPKNPTLNSTAKTVQTTLNNQTKPVARRLFSEDEDNNNGNQISLSLEDDPLLKTHQEIAKKYNIISPINNSNNDNESIASSEADTIGDENYQNNYSFSSNG